MSRILHQAQLGSQKKPTVPHGTATTSGMLEIKTCGGNRVLGVDLSTAILHAIAERPLVNIQRDVIHGKEEHQTGQEHSKQAMEHSAKAHQQSLEHKQSAYFATKHGKKKD